MFSIVRHFDGMGCESTNSERRILGSRGIITNVKTSCLAIEAKFETTEEADAKCREMLSADRDAKFYILDDEAKLISVIMDEERQCELTRKSDLKELWTIAAFVFLLSGVLPYLAATVGGMDWNTAFIVHFALVLGWWVQVLLRMNNRVEAAVVTMIFSIQLSILFPILNKVREQRRQRDAIQNQKNN